VAVGQRLMALLVVIPTTWLVVATLVVGTCRAAARGDRGGALGPHDQTGGGELDELGRLPVSLRALSRGARRSRAPSCAPL